MPTPPAAPDATPTDEPAASADLEPALAWDPEEDVPFGRANLVLIVLGVLALVGGFVLLPRVNADASNWEGTVSPLLLLSGYLLVFVGIILVVESPAPPDAPHS